MTQLTRFVKGAALFAIMIALLVSPSFFALAKGKGFKDVVKHIETNYGAKKVRIPFLGLANFAIKLIRPAGVKGFKLAVFEDQNFSAHERAASFDAVMREAYNKDWRPMVQVSSKRNGASHTFIYVRSSGKDVQFALAVLEDREAVVLEVKFNPDAAARFLENPKIMGVSLGKLIRAGNNAAVASNRPPRPAASNSSGPSAILRALIHHRPGRLRRRTSRPMKRNPRRRWTPHPMAETTPLCKPIRKPKTLPPRPR